MLSRVVLSYDWTINRVWSNTSSSTRFRLTHTGVGGWQHTGTCRGPCKSELTQPSVRAKLRPFSSHPGSLTHSLTWDKPHTLTQSHTHTLASSVWVCEGSDWTSTIQLRAPVRRLSSVHNAHWATVSWWRSPSCRPHKSTRLHSGLLLPRRHFRFMLLWTVV